jgi:hypothetical protein
MRRVEKAGGSVDREMASYVDQYQEFMNKWGVKSFKELPDYYNGLVALIGKYGESFNSAVVGHHKEALG